MVKFENQMMNYVVVEVDPFCVVLHLMRASYICACLWQKLYLFYYIYLASRSTKVFFSLFVLAQNGCTQQYKAGEMCGVDRFSAGVTTLAPSVATRSVEFPWHEGRSYGLTYVLHV
jgi:hypothetical protein